MDMEKNNECKDKQNIRYLISEELERIIQLNEILDMQGHWNCFVFCNVFFFVLKAYEINILSAFNNGKVQGTTTILE